MTEANAPVHVAVVLDRSGSMASIASDVAGGLNQFLEDQQKTATGPGRATL